MKFIGSLLVFSFVIFGFVPFGTADETAINATIVKSRPLVENRKTPVILHLEHESGFPVLPDELEIKHTEKVHLLIIDPTLSNYHHEHPLPMNAPGNYVFTMTPRTDCNYRIWADLDSVNSPQQFAVTDITGAKDCSDKKIDRAINTTYEGDNYRFILDFDTGGLKVGQDTMAKLTVRDKNGRYVHELEPIMGAYAHIVGFYDDYKTIAHMHPLGEEPYANYDRGGPTLKFHLNPIQSGYLKLFAQIKVNNMVVLAPFGVEVEASNNVIDDNIVDLPWLEELEIEREPEREPETEKSDARESKKGEGLDTLFQENEDTSTDVYENLEEKLLKEIPELDRSADPVRLEFKEDPF